MASYKAPLRDMRFVLYELHDAEGLTALPGYAEMKRDLLDPVLEESAKFCEEVLQPLNRSGDEEGCHYENGVVRTPKGFKEAFKQYGEQGWSGLGAPAEFGGSNLPNFITLVFGEMAQSANQAFTMYPGLSAAACSALIATGAPWMKEHIVPKMVSGEWTGTMCLTEPHCGTDLRLMKTRAVEQPDGTWWVNDVTIASPGIWTVRVLVQPSQGDAVLLDAPIVIEP